MKKHLDSCGKEIDNGDTVSIKTDKGKEYYEISVINDRYFVKNNLATLSLSLFNNKNIELVRKK